jgi:glycosyltransferase involved in cell wall biosynthesis
LGYFSILCIYLKIEYKALKTLLLTPYFAPYNNPRALRWAGMVKALEQAGDQVTVLCSQLSAAIAESGEFDSPIIPVGYNSLQEYLAFKNKKKAKKPASPTQSWKYMAHQLLWKPYIFPDESFIWKRPALKKAKELLQQEDFDAVISVGLPFSAHLVAKDLKSDFPQLTWLMDVGDPYALQDQHPISNPALFKKRSRILERECLLQCDRVVVTNDGLRQKYAQEMQIPQEKIAIIPPVNTIEFGQIASPPKGKTIRIAYFGNFFKNIRPPGILLDSIATMHAWMQSAGLPVEWHLYGDGFERFKLRSRIRNSGLPIEVHSKLDRSEIVRAIQSMHVLLHLGNATEFQIPSKIAEYICSGKPLLNILQIEKDPALALLVNYPYVKNLKAPLGSNDKEAVISFCKNSLSFIADGMLIEKHRERYRPEVIASKYLGHLTR